MNGNFVFCFQRTCLVKKLVYELTNSLIPHNALKMSSVKNGSQAPEVQTMIRDRSPKLTYGQAKANLETLSTPSKISGCYKVKMSSDAKVSYFGVEGGG